VQLRIVQSIADGILFLMPPFLFSFEREVVPLTNIRQFAAAREIVLYLTASTAKHFMFVMLGDTLKSKPMYNKKNGLQV